MKLSVFHFKTQPFAQCKHSFALFSLLKKFKSFKLFHLFFLGYSNTYFTSSNIPAMMVVYDVSTVENFPKYPCRLYDLKVQ